ncbi:MAG TPA: hypothetical protein VFG70_01285 [Gaiellaceae bacterium]|nr:hypothetical protein [Gaiellaceae bacterium]
MAARTRATGERAPAALPPERRTVGQLVAESIRFYGSHFARSLPLGLVVAGANQASLGLGREATTATLVLAAPLFTLAFAYASKLVSGGQPHPRAWIIALGAGTLVFVPAALLFPWFALAGVLWLALAGLCVPAALLESESFFGALRRGLALGRVDYLHAAGSLATLVILFVLARLGLALLLESQADNTVRVAVFLADAVIGPLLFLGGAILYVDQEARLRSRKRGKERNADLPDADDAHREGRPDPARKPGPTA